MAITWANILEWKTGPLDEIAQTLFEASQGLRDAYEKGQDHLNALQSEGEAVTAMRATTITNLASLERALTNVTGALMAIAGARDGVGEVIGHADSALASAAAHECTIDADGTVHTIDPDTKNQDILRAKISLSDMVKEILKYADQVDTDLYHALQDINNDRYTDGDGENNKVVGVPDLPQPNWTPSQVAAWWKSLTYEQQQFLTDRRPDDIRHLDGLPAVVRDKANHHALHGYLHADGKYRQGALKDAEEEAIEARKEYDKALADEANAAKKGSSGPAMLNHLPDGKLQKAKERLDRATEALDDLIAIDTQTDDMTRRRKGLPPAYLLDFDYDKKYQRTTAIVSAGNPDTATHVSTLVPGIGTNVRDSLGQYMEINDRLREQTKHAGINPNTVATISYLGYVAPRNDGANIVQAANIDYANRAAPKLAQFEEGLRASANANGHKFLNTLLTHSYGSTTGGKSATLMAPGTVDRLILTGSPGGGVDSIDEYNVPKKQVYVSAVPSGDSVEGLGSIIGYGEDPRKLEGITHLSGDATGSEDYKISFRGFSTVNHMAYFHEGTRTSQDFANIIAGGKQTTDEEWEALQRAEGKVTELDRKPWMKKYLHSR